MPKPDKKEILNSTLKSAFGAIPFAGTALNELFFEYNSSLKQKRLNRFIEILSEYFFINQDVKIENIKTEDFNDLFESVLKRVVQTKSEAKLLRFRDIIINQLNSPSDETEIVDLYLEIISSLSEIELTILYNHRVFDLKYEDLIDKMNSLKDSLNGFDERKKRETVNVDKFRIGEEKKEAENKISEIQEKLGSLHKYRKAEFYNISNDKFQFYKQRLFSKGLLVDNRRNRIGSDAFEAMGITEFGLEFINFIKTE